MNRFVKTLLASIAAMPLAAGLAMAGEPVVIPAPAPHVHVNPCPCVPKKNGEKPTYVIKAEIEEDDGCEIKLGCRKAVATPHRECCNKTGGGNIDVQQPDDNTVVITMTGAAVAYNCPLKCSSAGMNFDLNQQFKIDCGEDCKYKKMKLEISGRLMGVLRSHCKGGSAEVSHATATIACTDAHASREVATIHMPSHVAAGGENLSVNDVEGPICVPICCGCYTLHQCFSLSAHGAKSCAKAASVEFADGAIDPLWISYKEPFHGAAKKDFGFQITIKLVAEDCPEENGAAPAAEPMKEAIPLPKAGMKE